MKKGRAGTMTHDYKRNGVTTLFAALVAAKAKSVTQMQAGEVIGECMPRHRAKEFLRFLKKIDATVARPLDVHVVCDNYRTHKTKEVQAWLAKHPRFKMHYTPTSSSWLNLVERLFAEITRQQIRRGASHCLTRNVTGRMTARTVAGTPNRIGVANGGTDQHERTARDYSGGGGTLPIGGAGGKGADPR
jgi:transposase